MRDNVSMIIATIIGVLLVVLLPLISILERQDNVAYNIALTLTTDFIDEVREKGFIDKKLYDKYMDDMSRTNNSYDYRIEVHKSIIIPVVDDGGAIIANKFVEDKIIENKNDIEAAFDDTISKESAEKNSVYLLEEGEEIYISVKNTNTPSSSLMYKYISGESNDTVIDITYGGRVKNVNWELYAQVDELSRKILKPNIDISIPTNMDNNNNVKIESIIDEDGTEISKTYSYVYKVGDEAPAIPATADKDREITYDIVLTNFDSFYNADGMPNDNLTVKMLLDSIEIKNCEAEIEVMIGGMVCTNEDIVIAHTSQTINKFKIKLKNILTTSLQADIGFTIKPNLGSNNGYPSVAQDSEDVVFVSEYNVHSVEITGPYNPITNQLMPKVSNGGAEYFAMYKDFESYFIVKFTSIHTTIDELFNGINNNKDILVHYLDSAIDMSKYEIGSLEITYDEALKFGKIKVPVKYIDYPADGLIESTRANNSKLKRNNLYLPENWVLGAKTWGIDENTRGAVSEKYGVFVDIKPPSAKESMTVYHPTATDEMAAIYDSSSKAYLVPGNFVNIKFSDATDDAKSSGDEQGIGMYKVGIKNKGEPDYTWYTYEEGMVIQNNQLNFGASADTSVFVKYQDYMGNTSAEKEIKFLKDSDELEFELIAETVSGATAVEKTWYNENIDLTAIVTNRTTGYKTSIKNITSGATTGEKINSSSKMTLEDNGKNAIEAKAELTSVYFPNIKSTISKEFWIDKQDPTLTNIDSIPTAWVKELDVKFNATDAISGINKVEYCLRNDGEAAPLAEDYIGGLTLSNGQFNLKDIIKETGEKKLYIKVLDKALNDTVKDYNIKVDQTAPEVTWRINPSDSAKIDITIKDDHSGIKNQIFYYTMNSSFGSPGNNTTSYPYRITINEEHTITITIDKIASSGYLHLLVSDNVGNLTKKTFEIFENPKIVIVNSHEGLDPVGGGRAQHNTIARYNSSETADTASELVFGRFGIIRYEIQDISSHSELYILTTTTENDLRDASGNIDINKINQKKANPNNILTPYMPSVGTFGRSGRLKIDHNSALTTYYINFVIIKTNGEYMLRTVKVSTNSNPRIASVITQEVVCVWPLPGCTDIRAKKEYMVWNNSNSVDVESSRDDRFRVSSIFVARGEKYSGTIRLQVYNDNPFVKRWEDQGSVNSGETEFVEFKYTESDKTIKSNVRFRIIDGSGNVLDEIMIN